MQVTKEFRFEASHVLPKHKGKCSRLHGHSWVLRVSVDGKVDKESGFVIDYADISQVVQPIIEKLDHRHLGQWFGEAAWHHPTEWEVKGMEFDFYPSSENLLLWLGDQLEESDLIWSKLELNETCTSSAVLLRNEFLRAKLGL